MTDLRAWGLALGGSVFASCGNVVEPMGGTAEVSFVYEAATAIDPDVLNANPGCVNGVGQTHIHASWRGFQALAMTAGNNRWTITFADAPVAIQNRIRVSDPNVCADNPTGASTVGVSANGVTLSRIVDTPGSGTEPGLAFTISIDGVVSP